jgi:hypothetical protein
LPASRSRVLTASSRIMPASRSLTAAGNDDPVLDGAAGRSGSNGPQSQRILRLASLWCGREGHRCAQSRVTSARNPASLRRPSRWLTIAIVSSSVSLQGRRRAWPWRMTMALALIRPSISTYTQAKILGQRHGGGLCCSAVFDDRLSAAGEWSRFSA